jgi:hypothetical protein
LIDIDYLAIKGIKARIQRYNLHRRLDAPWVEVIVA